MTKSFNSSIEDAATQSLSPIKRARRERLLEIGQTVFMEQGFRAATMEGIAEAATVSKATLYSYFPDKASLFSAVASRIAGQLEAGVTEALQSKGSVAARCLNALQFKHDLVWGIVRTSPHASDLFAAKSSLSQADFSSLDERIEAAMASCLESEGEYSRKVSQTLARQLFGASNGIANRAETIRQMQADLKSLVEAYLGPT